MNWLYAANRDFRSQRKCYHTAGSMLLMLALSVVVVTCRPPDEVYENFNVGEEYPDADNVEWHHVKVVDGVMHEDHPVIMYKEDFVSEDYDPNSKSAESSRPQRKYKDIAHRRRHPNMNDTAQYRALKPEKIYFDVLPPHPVVVADDASGNDSKFDASKIRVELISLTDNNSAEQEKSLSEEQAPSKQELSKHPKKYHSRQRRQANEEHVLHKRNPYINPYYNPYGYNNYINEQPQRTSYSYPVPYNPQYTFVSRPKVPVAGKKHNALDIPVPEPDINFGQRFGPSDETDRVIWGRRPQSSRPQNRPEFERPARPTNRPARPQEPVLPPLIHNTDVDEMDFSFAGQQPSGRPAATTRRPATTTVAAATTRRPEPDPATESSVSECVWAIANCCSNSDAKLRYQCFERLGCIGAFWGLSPCADTVRDNVVDLITDVFQ